MDKNKQVDEQDIFQQFEQKRAHFNEQRYVSRFTESARFVRFGKSVKIKANIEEIWPVLLENSMQSIHPDLKASDAKLNGIYRSGKSQGKQYLHLSKFENNENDKTIEIEFFQPNGWYRRSLKLIKRNNYCKIKYYEIIKSLNEVFGLLSMIEKKRYSKQQLTIFRLQIFDLLKHLNLLSLKQIRNFDKTQQKVKTKILRLQSRKFKK